MKLTRTFALTDIVLRAHILNPFWWPRQKRHDWRCDVAKVAIPRYLKRYLPALGAVKEQVPVVDANEKIYTLWLQGEENAPDLVKACFRSVRANCAQELVVLDENTIFDYITLPDVIMKKRQRGQIKHAHFADICRVELLYKYGGFWMDATGFVTAPIPQNIVDADFFMYMAGETAGSAYSYVQNCFIRGRRGSYLLNAWREMIINFWTAEPKEFDYFMHQLMFKALVQNDAVAAKYFEKMPHVNQSPTHALWWSVADKPFSKTVFDKYTSGAFFQKTTYTSPWAKKPVSGTIAYEMIYNMYKN